MFSIRKQKKNRGEEEEEAEGERDVHVRVLTLTLMRVIILDLQFSLLIKISPALESKKKKYRKIHGIALHFALFFSSELMACFWPDNNECLFSPSSHLHSSFCISFNIWNFFYSIRPCVCVCIEFGSFKLSGSAAAFVNAISLLFFVFLDFFPLSLLVVYHHGDSNNGRRRRRWGGSGGGCWLKKVHLTPN